MLMNHSVLCVLSTTFGTLYMLISHFEKPLCVDLLLFIHWLTICLPYMCLSATFGALYLLMICFMCANQPLLKPSMWWSAFFGYLYVLIRHFWSSRCAAQQVLEHYLCCSTTFRVLYVLVIDFWITSGRSFLEKHSIMEICKSPWCSMKHLRRASQGSTPKWSIMHLPDATQNILEDLCKTPPERLHEVPLGELTRQAPVNRASQSPLLLCRTPQSSLLNHLYRSFAVKYLTWSFVKHL